MQALPASRSLPIVDDDPPIDDRNEIKDFSMLLADQPVDAGGRKGAPQRCRHRNGVNDVAERPEAD